MNSKKKFHRNQFFCNILSIIQNIYLLINFNANVFENNVLK